MSAFFKPLMDNAQKAQGTGPDTGPQAPGEAGEAKNNIPAWTTVFTGETFPAATSCRRAKFWDIFRWAC